MNIEEFSELSSKAIKWRDEALEVEREVIFAQREAIIELLKYVPIEHQIRILNPLNKVFVDSQKKLGL
jgi:hypothetical protein